MEDSLELPDDYEWQGSTNSCQEQLGTQKDNKRGEMNNLNIKYISNMKNHIQPIPSVQTDAPITPRQQHDYQYSYNPPFPSSQSANSMGQSIQLNTPTPTINFLSPSISSNLNNSLTYSAMTPPVSAGKVVVVGDSYNYPASNYVNGYQNINHLKGFQNINHLKGYQNNLKLKYNSNPTIILQPQTQHTTPIITSQTTQQTTPQLSPNSNQQFQFVMSPLNGIEISSGQINRQEKRGGNVRDKIDNGRDKIDNRGNNKGGGVKLVNRDSRFKIQDKNGGYGGSNGFNNKDGNIVSNQGGNIGNYKNQTPKLIYKQTSSSNNNNNKDRSVNSNNSNTNIRSISNSNSTGVLNRQSISPKPTTPTITPYNSKPLSPITPHNPKHISSKTSHNSKPNLNTHPYIKPSQTTNKQLLSNIIECSLSAVMDQSNSSSIIRVPTQNTPERHIYSFEVVRNQGDSKDRNIMDSKGLQNQFRGIQNQFRRVQKDNQVINDRGLQNNLRRVQKRRPQIINSKSQLQNSLNSQNVLINNNHIKHNHSILPNQNNKFIDKPIIKVYSQKSIKKESNRKQDSLENIQINIENYQIDRQNQQQNRENYQLENQQQKRENYQRKRENQQLNRENYQIKNKQTHLNVVRKLQNNHFNSLIQEGINLNSNYNSNNNKRQLPNGPNGIYQGTNKQLKPNGPYQGTNKGNNQFNHSFNGQPIRDYNRSNSIQAKRIQEDNFKMNENIQKTNQSIKKNEENIRMNNQFNGNYNEGNTNNQLIYKSQYGRVEKDNNNIQIKRIIKLQQQQQQFKLQDNNKSNVSYKGSYANSQKGNYPQKDSQHAQKPNPNQHRLPDTYKPEPLLHPIILQNQSLHQYIDQYHKSLTGHQSRIAVLEAEIERLRHSYNGYLEDERPKLIQEIDRMGRLLRQKDRMRITGMQLKMNKVVEMVVNNSDSQPNNRTNEILTQTSDIKPQSVQSNQQVPITIQPIRSPLKCSPCQLLLCEVSFLRKQRDYYRNAYHQRLKDSAELKVITALKAMK